MLRGHRADVVWVNRRLVDLGETLAGTWILTSIQPAGQAEQAKPDGATYSLTLTDGRLSSRVDCNSCSGTFALSGSTLTTGPALACTRAACPTMAFENTYTRLLGGKNAVTASGNTLVLSSTRELCASSDNQHVHHSGQRSIRTTGSSCRAAGKTKRAPLGALFVAWPLQSIFVLPER